MVEQKTKKKLTLTISNKKTFINNKEQNLFDS